MKRSLAFAAMPVIVLLLTPATPALADEDTKKDHEPRMELSFMFAYDTLLGDVSNSFEDGPYAGFGFEYDLNAPRKKEALRAFALRITAGYSGFDGAYYDTSWRARSLDWTRSWWRTRATW